MINLNNKIFNISKVFGKGKRPLVIKNCKLIAKNNEKEVTYDVDKVYIFNYEKKIKYHKGDGKILDEKNGIQFYYGYMIIFLSDGNELLKKYVKSKFSIEKLIDKNSELLCPINQKNRKVYTNIKIKKLELEQNKYIIKFKAYDCKNESDIINLR